MSAPWVFTPDTMETITRMRNDGATSRQIAKAIGSTADSVRQTIVNNRRGRIHDDRLEFRITPSIKEAYYAEAQRRGMKARPFVRMMLTTIAKDNLFSAILDDGK